MPRQRPDWPLFIKSVGATLEVAGVVSGSNSAASLRMAAKVALPAMRSVSECRAFCLDEFGDAPGFTNEIGLQIAVMDEQNV